MPDFGLGDFLYLSMFVLFPAAVLAFVRPIVRFVLIAIGTISIPAFFWFAQIFSIHGAELLLPAAGFFLGAGALLVETIAFRLRLIRKPKPAKPS